MTAGLTHDPVEKIREGYTVKVIYQAVDAKVVGNLSDKFNTIAGFNAGAAVLLASAALASAHGGTAARDVEKETFSATLRCHYANGELYKVTFGRSRVSISS
jgi:hypothetical protein